MARYAFKMNARRRKIVSQSRRTGGGFPAGDGEGWSSFQGSRRRPAAREGWRPTLMVFLDASLSRSRAMLADIFVMSIER
jgi:hypothetical protein